MLKRYRTDGEAGIAHGTRGKPSPRRLEANTRDLIVALARTTYVDHNDCHLTQKLQGAPYRLAVSRTTVRKVRRAAGWGVPASGGHPASGNGSNDGHARACYSKPMAAATTFLVG